MLICSCAVMAYCIKVKYSYWYSYESQLYKDESHLKKKSPFSYLSAVLEKLKFVCMTCLSIKNALDIKK